MFDASGDWLDVHPRELLVVAPANVHSEYDRYDYAETDRKWFALFGEKFSGGTQSFRESTIARCLACIGHTAQEHLPTSGMLW